MQCGLFREPDLRGGGAIPMASLQTVAKAGRVR